MACSCPRTPSPTWSRSSRATTSTGPRAPDHLHRDPRSVREGEPADPITVAAELTKRGEITKVGGASYLHTLVQTVPTAANAEYYAEIVHERAVLRRLVEAGTRITQMGYAADGDVDEIVNTAQAEIYAVTEQRTTEDDLPLGDIMEGALDEIEAIGFTVGRDDRCADGLHRPGLADERSAPGPDDHHRGSSRDG